MNNHTSFPACRSCGHPTDAAGCLRHPLPEEIANHPEWGNDLSQMQGHTMALLGKSVLNCNVEDLNEVTSIMQARMTRELAELDQMEALLAEAHRCGCDIIAVPYDEHGNSDTARGIILHTCGRRGGGA